LRSAAGLAEVVTVGGSGERAGAAAGDSDVEMRPAGTPAAALADVNCDTGLPAAARLTTRVSGASAFSSATPAGAGGSAASATSGGPVPATVGAGGEHVVLADPSMALQEHEARLGNMLVSAPIRSVAWSPDGGTVVFVASMAKPVRGEPLYHRVIFRFTRTGCTKGGAAGKPAASSAASARPGSSAGGGLGAVAAQAEAEAEAAERDGEGSACRDGDGNIVMGRGSGVVGGVVSAGSGVEESGSEADGEG
jgi:hypothetical protein